MRQFREALKAAIEVGSVPAAIEALVGIAEVLIERGELDRSVEILTLVLCYPMHRETRELVEAMLLDLEAEVCPRVMTDAKTRCDQVTLDDMSSEVLTQIESDSGSAPASW